MVHLDWNLCLSSNPSPCSPNWATDPFTESHEIVYVLVNDLRRQHHLWQFFTSFRSCTLRFWKLQLKCIRCVPGVQWCFLQHCFLSLGVKPSFRNLATQSVSSEMRLVEVHWRNTGALSCLSHGLCAVALAKRLRVTLHSAGLSFSTSQFIYNSISLHKSL